MESVRASDFIQRCQCGVPQKSSNIHSNTTQPHTFIVETVFEYIPFPKVSTEIQQALLVSVGRPGWRRWIMDDAARRV